MKNALSPALSRRSILLAGAASLALAGCASMIGPGPAPQLYVLRPKLGPIADVPEAAWQLGVPLPTTAQSLDTDRIALELTPETMDYYANAAWPDRVPVIVQRTLLEAFEMSGKIKAVARDTEGMRADYLLQSDLRSFEARYDVPDTAPTIVIDISVKLLKPEGREIVATLQSRHTAQASANSVPAVVAAFDEALGEAAEDIAAWTLKAPPPVAEASEIDTRHRRARR